MTLQAPLVSIITPTYNHEDHIGSCIESILDQNFSNWEQIIIDDGSIDNTAKIIKKFSDERIIYIKQENVGISHLASVYNRALSIARGDLIAILEGDDTWPCNKLSLQTPIFKNKNVVLCWGQLGIIDDNDNRIGYSKGLPIGFRKAGKDVINNNPPGSIVKALIRDNFINPVTVMIRKDSLLSIGGFKQPNNVPYVDYPTWLHLTLMGQFYWVDEVLGNWRQHGGQYTAEHRLEMTMAANRLVSDFLNNLHEGEQKSLGLNLNSGFISEINRERQAWSLINRGRRYFVNSERIKGKNDFVDAFKLGSPCIKICAALGLLSYYLSFDLEELINDVKSHL